MKKHANEIYVQEMVPLSKIFMGFLLGVGSIGGIWIISGLLIQIAYSM